MRRFISFSNSWPVHMRVFICCVLSVSGLASPLVLGGQQSLLESTVRVRVVNIHSTTVSFGAGVAVEEGLILTAAHVVGKGGDVEILVGNGDDTESFDGKVERIDPLLDLCLVRVVDAFEKKANIPAVKIATQFPVATGTKVFAIGNPLGFTLTVSQGVVSASGVNRGEKFLLTDALVKSGNSGGPLVNEQGELLGVVISSVEAQGVKEDSTRSYGNVLPSETIKAFLSQSGVKNEGVLGVMGKTVSTGFGNLAASEGLKIEKVIRPESGLRVGDVLMMVEETPVSTMKSLVALVRPVKPGTTLKGYVLRQGMFKEVTMCIGSIKNY